MEGLRIPIAVVVTLSCFVTFATSNATKSDDRKVHKASGQHLIYVENDGPLEIKCALHQEMVIADVYAVCMNTFKNNDIAGKMNHKEEDFNKSFVNHCPAYFEKKEPCVLWINHQESLFMRFRTLGDLKCPEGALFLGLYYCQDKTPTLVEDGENVNIYKLHTEALSPKCPIGKKVSVINAGQRGNVMCNKGHVSSTITRASELCNNKETCEIPFDSTLSPACDKFKQTHFVTYRCI